ncbi:C40 family peptidase [Effusibacillus consociatus]|uniref:C40 family peptidase n=1 Tax=Effusibacillus consociatus TaxID=1117041 RepID=A0ABV9Q4B5_9BACL
MKRFWQLLLVTPLLFVTVGNTPVYAEQPVAPDELADATAVPEDHMLVNAIQDKSIIVKDKRIFQERFLRNAQQYVEKSSSKPIVFHDPHVFYCSGFVQQIYRINGIWIPAHSLAQQTKFGARINKFEHVETGDLVFFSSSSSNKVPAHVAIALNREKLLHASGDNHQVSVIDVNDDIRTHFMFATRLVSSV